WTRPLPTRSHTGHERSGQRETSHSHRGGWIPPPRTRLAGAQPLDGDAPLSLIMTKSTGQAPTSPAVIGVPSARFLGPSQQIDKLQHHSLPTTLPSSAPDKLFDVIDLARVQLSQELDSATRARYVRRRESVSIRATSSGSSENRIRSKLAAIRSGLTDFGIA